jgi:pyrroloquinoline quinone biosynthesis protein B
VGVAATADDEHWLLIGASPDLRQQILQTPALHPAAGARHSPVAAVVLLSADVDGIAGLLVLREQQKLRIMAPAPILAILAQNQIFAVLDSRIVERIELPPNTPVTAVPGLSLTLLPMPGKIPLYQEPVPPTRQSSRRTAAASSSLPPVPRSPSLSGRTWLPPMSSSSTARSSRMMK